MSDYAVARLEDIEELNDGRCPLRPVRHHLGITSFGINAWTGRAVGDRIINEHDEDEANGQEELYLVLTGRATFELGDEQVDASAGTFVFVRPGLRRTAVAQEPDTTIVAVGATPGKVYEPDGWELWGALHPLYEAGRYEEAADRAQELLERETSYAALYYNTACVESLAGRRGAALEHLRRAVELSEDSRGLAREDSDFDPIRDEPGFKELVGG